MPIRVKCENCKKTLSVKDHLAGKKIKCPVCQNVVLVSASASPPKPPTAPGAPSNPATATKPKTAKPATEKPASNGTPVNGSAKSNGVPAKPPEPVAPPENVEEEALSAFRDEPKPELDEGPPQTIDFACPWCDAELHLPLDMAGKQAPCPNEDCKRIIKIPLPKVTEKKDWRKMDRRGPAAALINQQEQLDDAWGTEEAVKARQTSLAQAGAIEAPPKPGIGVFGWIRLAFIWGVCVPAVLGVLCVFIVSLLETAEIVNAEKDVASMLESKPPNPPRILDPLLQAEAKRTLAELYLRAAQAKGKASAARDVFAGARAMATPMNAEVSPHKQLFLIELALLQIDLGGPEDEWIAKKKLPWDDAEREISLTLNAIHPDVQLMAVREVALRLLERNQPKIANTVAGKLSSPDPNTGRRPLTAAQQIALLKMKDDVDALAPFGKLPDMERDKNKEFFDAPIRVGYAEGLAHKGSYPEALAWVQLPGPAKDRLEAALGAAAVALSAKRNKSEAGKFVKEAMGIAKENQARSPISPWQRLQLIRLAARTDEVNAAKEMVNTLPPAFKLRGQLELMIAECDLAPGPLTREALPDFAPADDKDGLCLALAWLQLARHNASKGSDRKQNRAAFEYYLKISPPANPEMIRPIVDLGTYQGTRK